MVKLDFKTQQGMTVLETLTHKGELVSDKLMRRVFPRVGHVIKHSQKPYLWKSLTKRKSYEGIYGREGHFISMMFSPKWFNSKEGMFYRVNKRKPMLVMYMVKEDLYTRADAIKYKNKAMSKIINSTQHLWQTAAEKALDDGMKELGWK